MCTSCVRLPHLHTCLEGCVTRGAFGLNMDPNITFPSPAFYLSFSFGPLFCLSRFSHLFPEPGLSLLFVFQQGPLSYTHCMSSIFDTSNCRDKKKKQKTKRRRKAGQAANIMFRTWSYSNIFLIKWIKRVHMIYFDFILFHSTEKYTLHI